MTPRKGLVKHDPDNGSYGDCFRTAIACLLDEEPEEVPHFLHDGPDATEADRRAQEWLRPRGLHLFEIPYQTDDLDLVLSIMRRINPGCHYLLTGRSRMSEAHVVICLGDEIVHDPSPVDSGIVGPTFGGLYWVSVLARL